ncbi:MAG: hypothetical protein JSR76_01055 [Verrucomicrobia bacterium]|nr:hypothetical protein [Verrucomicrobiota bacterium]
MIKSIKKHLNLFVIFCLNSMGSLYGASYDKYVDEIISSFTKDVEKQYGVVCYGSGGRMPRDVETIKLCFNAYQRATIDEAREMVVGLLLHQIELKKKRPLFLY